MRIKQILLDIQILFNVLIILLTLSSDKWYVLPVYVSGISILQRIYVLGTQHMSSLLGHINDEDGP